MIYKCLKNRQRICHVGGLSKQEIKLSVLKKKASNSEYLEIKTIYDKNSKNFKNKQDYLKMLLWTNI